MERSERKLQKRIKKKIDGPRSGDGAPPQSPWFIHFKALQCLRDVMKPGKTSGNIEFTPICDAEQQKSLDEEIINVREAKNTRLMIHFRRTPLLKYRILLRLRI
jgi:hypothetical protein